MNEIADFLTNETVGFVFLDIFHLDKPQQGVIAFKITIRIEYLFSKSIRVNDFVHFQIRSGISVSTVS